jgi:hypothetical protein
VALVASLENRTNAVVHQDTQEITAKWTKHRVKLLILQNATIVVGETSYRKNATNGRVATTTVSATFRGAFTRISNVTSRSPRELIVDSVEFRGSSVSTEDVVLTMILTQIPMDLCAICGRIRRVLGSRLKIAFNKEAPR